MQFESFHWLSHHRLWAIIPWSANMVSKRIIFGAFLFWVYSTFLYFGGIFNKTITPLALVGYEMITANSYPTRAREIIVKMVSAEHSSNNGKDKVTKKPSKHNNILNKGKKNLSRLKLSSWPRERKLNFKLSIFPMKRTFRVSWKHKCIHWASLRALMFFRE